MSQEGIDFFVLSGVGFFALVVADMDLVEDEEALLELELMDALESRELDVMDDADMLDSRSAVEALGELWFERLAKVDLTGIRGAWFMSNRGRCCWRLMPGLESALRFVWVLLLFVAGSIMVN